MPINGEYVRNVFVVPDAIFERLLEIEVPILEEAIEVVAQQLRNRGKGQLDFAVDPATHDVADIDRVKTRELISDNMLRTGHDLDGLFNEFLLVVRKHCLFPQNAGTRQQTPKAHRQALTQALNSSYNGLSITVKSLSR